MVHPKVLENCGIDPNVYSVFAFGFGAERIAMAKYGIDDMRLLYEKDRLLTIINIGFLTKKYLQKKGFFIIYERKDESVHF